MTYDDDSNCGRRLPPFPYGLPSGVASKQATRPIGTLGDGRVQEQLRRHGSAESYVEAIESKDASLTIATTSEDRGGEQKYLTKLTTDGRDNLNEINGNEFHSKSRWEGGKLVTTVTGDRGMQLVEVRSLSSDGKTQTVETYMGQAGGTPQMKRVMQKKSR